MKTYDLYLDSGPKMKKTIVQVPAIMGCVARGDTTDEATANTPDAIRVYMRFLARHGEPYDPEAAFRTRVALHVTDGVFPAGGVGFIAPDDKPLTPRDADALMTRLGHIHDAIRALAGSLAAKELDAKPASGRPIRGILVHVCAEGNYLRGVTGAGRIQRLADKGQMDPLDALDELLVLEKERLRTMPPEERAGMVMRGKTPWSARFAVRRMLEHAWEHCCEIADRVGATP